MQPPGTSAFLLLSLFRLFLLDLAGQAVCLDDRLGGHFPEHGVVELVPVAAVLNLHQLFYLLVAALGLVS